MKFRSKILVLFLSLSLLSACGGNAAASSGLGGGNTIAISLGLDSDLSYAGSWYIDLPANFPNYKFTFINGTINEPSAELAREISHGQVADIVLSSHFRTDLLGLDTAFDDLSARDYVSNYSNSYLDSVAKDGKLYYLPIAQTLRGYVYNKTLFDEKGWAIPTDYASLQSLFATIEKAGYATSMNFLNTYRAGDEFSTQFHHYYSLDLGRKLSNYAWLKNFNARKASINDVDWSAVMSDWDDWFARTSASTATGTMIKLLASRQAAIIGCDTSIAPQLTAASKDEFRLLPYFGSASEGGWLLSDGLYSIAMSAASAKDSAKKKAMDEVFAYLTSPEGQKFVAQSTNSVISPVDGTISPQSAPFFSDVNATIKEGRILTVDRFAHIEDRIQSDFLAYAEKKISKEELFADLETANMGADDTETVVATASADYSYPQMSELALEVLQEKGESDLSFLYQDAEGAHYGNLPYARRSLSGVFYKGDISIQDLKCCFARRFYGPNGSTSESPLCLERYSMSGAQLLKLFAYGTGYWLGGGKTVYSWNSEKNLYEATAIRFNNGKSFSLDGIYTLSAPNQIALAEGSYQSQETLATTFYDAAKDWVSAAKNLTPKDLADSVYEGK